MKLSKKPLSITQVLSCRHIWIEGVCAKSSVKKEDVYGE